MFRFRWEHSKNSPAGKFDTLSWHSMQQYRSHVVLWRRAQKLVWGHFRGLWQSLTPSKTWQLFPCSWASYAPSGEMNTCDIQRGVLYPSQLCKGGHWHDKKHYSSSTGSVSYPLSGFSLIWLRPQAVAKERLVCCGHVLVMGCVCTPLLLLCRSALSPPHLQKLSSSPSVEELKPGLSKPPLLVQMADCLSH